jgi:alkylation response protein AidB-like acyl-CoA dehydrogenase
MDFSFNESQTAVAELARKIFQTRVTPQSLKATEAQPERIDRALWSELASVGLLATALPESAGGSGYGLLELCALLEEAGASLAPVPLWSTLLVGAMPVAEFGTDAQRARLLPGVASGDTLLTAGLSEAANDDPMQPATTARRAGDAWVLRGVKECVPMATASARILVAARTGADACGVFLVDPHAQGVTLERQVVTTGEAHHRLVLDDVTVEASDVLGDPLRGADVLAWLLPRALVGLCAHELGIVEHVLRLTASYTTGRTQFERPIATFQAVSQRMGDAYIDVESIRLATWQAAWRLSQGLPASSAVAIAKFFAAEAGHRVVYAAQHLHGGMGFDVDYPLYRYYLRSKQNEITLGSASTHLAALGAELAR